MKSRLLFRSMVACGLCAGCLVLQGATIGTDHLPNAAAHIGTIVINNDDQFTTSTYVTLTLQAVTNNSGGVSQMQFSNDGNTWSAPEPYLSTKGWQLPAGVFPPRMNTTLKTVYVRFRDLAGQWSKAVSDGIVLARFADVPRLKHVYIGQQRPADYDGTQPLGTIRNPYLVPASNNESAFDSLMNWLMLNYGDYAPRADPTTNAPAPATNSTALTVHLGAGTYETHGDSRLFGDNFAWSPHHGWRVLGAGKDVTTLKLFGVGSSSYFWGNVIGGYYGNVACYDNLEIKDLTLDANLRDPGSNVRRYTCGITLVGNNVQIRRVKIKNFGTTIVNAETAGVQALNFGSYEGDWNFHMEDCDVVQGQAGNAYKSGMIIVLGTFGPDSLLRYYHNVVVRNCYVNGGPYWNDTALNPTEYAFNDRGVFGMSIGGTEQSVVEDNLVVNTVNGYYLDSSGMRNLQVRNNHFRNVFFGAGLVLGSRPVHSTRVEDVFRFENNLVELEPRFYPVGDSWGPYGWRFCLRVVGDTMPTNGYTYNQVIISSNLFQFTDAQAPQMNVGALIGTIDGVGAADFQGNKFYNVARPLRWQNEPEYLQAQANLVNPNNPSPVSFRNNTRGNRTVVECYPYVLDPALPRPTFVAGTEISFPLPTIGGTVAAMASGMPADNCLDGTGHFRWPSGPLDAGRYVLSFYRNSSRTNDPQRTLVTVVDRLPAGDARYFAHGLKTFWRFDDNPGITLAEKSGNHLDIDASPAVNRNLLTFAVPGYLPGRLALQFRGTLQYGNWAFLAPNSNSCLFANLPASYHALLERDTTLYHPFTISFWFKVESAPSQAQLIFADLGGLVCTVGPSENSLTRNCRLYFATMDNLVGLADDNVTPGAWHHVMVVYDGASLSLRVDDQVSARASFAILAGAQPGSNLIFGGGLAYSDFAGFLSDFAIWTRPFSEVDCTRLHQDQATGVQPSLVPVGPSDLSAVSDSTSATLLWQDNSSNETGFAVERSLDGANFQLLAVVPADNHSYTDGSEPASQVVYYRVRATHPAGNSEYSNIAAVGGSRPRQPSNLRVISSR